MIARIQTWTAALLVGAAVLLVACGSGGGGTVSWRDLTLRLPDGWIEVTNRDTLLMIADGEPDAEPGKRGSQTVAVQFTAEDSPTIDAWKDLVTGDGGTIESESQRDLGGVTASTLTYSWVTNGIPTRERVVVVPSRGVVIIEQPVPVRGQTDAPEVFLANIDAFDAVLDSIRFGAPEGYLDR